MKKGTLLYCSFWGASSNEEPIFAISPTRSLHMDRGLGLGGKGKGRGAKGRDARSRPEARARGPRPGRQGPAAEGQCPEPRGRRPWPQRQPGYHPPRPRRSPRGKCDGWPAESLPRFHIFDKASPWATASSARAWSRRNPFFNRRLACFGSELTIDSSIVRLRFGVLLRQPSLARLHMWKGGLEHSSRSQT